MRDTQSAVKLTDTSAKAQEVYYRRLGQMTPSERVNLGVSLWEAANSLQRAAVRGNLDETEIDFRIAVSRFGSELARKAYRKP